MFKKKILGVVVGLSLFASSEFSHSYNAGSFYGGVNSAIKAALPQPYLSGYDLATGFFGGLLPHPDVDGEILHDLSLVQNQLNVIEQQMVKVLQLDAATVALIVAQDQGQNFVKLQDVIGDGPGGDGILSSSGIQKIKEMYENFYSSSGNAKAIFPISGDYYSYAKTLCDNSNGCTEQGSTGQRAVNLLTGETDNETLKDLLQLYQSSLTKNNDTWDNLNNTYSTYLNGTDGALSQINEDYVAKYIKATTPVMGLEIRYYQALMMLYNIQALQLAFYYVSPDLMKDSDAFAKTVNGLNILSTKTGSDGYEEAMQNLTQAYVNNFLSSEAAYAIMNIFGGRYLTVSDGKFTIDSGSVLSPVLSNLLTMNDFIADVIDNHSLQLFNSEANTGGPDSKSLFKESGSGLLGPNYQPATAFLNNCQIINARFPATETASVTQLKFICNVEQDGQAYTTSALKISVPYSVTGSDNDLQFSFSMNNLDLAYDSSLKHYYIIPHNNKDNDFFASNNMLDPAGTLYDITFDGGGYDSEASFNNTAYVFDCRGGAGKSGKCHIAYSPTGVSFSNMVQFAYLGTTQNTARESCVLSSQTYDGASCLEQSFGLNGYTSFAYADYYTHSHSSAGANVYVYALTLNGDVMSIQIGFPSASGRNALNGENNSRGVADQTIIPGCLEGDSTCFREYCYYDQDNQYQCNYAAINFYYGGDNNVGNGEVVIDSKGIDKTSISPTNAEEDLFNYKTWEFSSTVLPRYVFAISDDYKKWLDSIAQGNSVYGDSVSTVYGLDLTFMDATHQYDKMVVILQSANGQYRLVYTGNANPSDQDNDGTNYSLAVQELKDGKWSNSYNAFDYDTKSDVSSGASKIPAEIAAVSFQNGNLTTYYYDPDWKSNSESSPYQVINSVALEYQSHGYQWVPDPYASLVMNNNGHLDIVSSNDESVTGNNLGYLLNSQGTQILWANYWYNNQDDWNKLQNPKLPSSSSTAKATEE